MSTSSENGSCCPVNWSCWNSASRVDRPWYRIRPLMMVVDKVSVDGLTQLPSGLLFCNSIRSSCTALSTTGFLLLLLGSPISTCKRAFCMVVSKHSAMNPGPGSQRIVAGGGGGTVRGQYHCTIFSDDCHCGFQDPCN